MEAEESEARKAVRASAVCWGDGPEEVFEGLDVEGAAGEGDDIYIESLRGYVEVVSLTIK